jgi:hypothetical protein
MASLSSTEKLKSSAQLVRKRSSKSRYTPCSTIETAISMVVSKVPSRESKDGSLTILREPSLLRTARSLFSLNKVYTFRMHTAVGTIASTSGGVILGTIPINAADTTYSEWSALSILFDEVKLQHAGIRLMPLMGSNMNRNDGTSGQIIAPNLFMCFSPDNRNTSPSGLLTVSRVATYWTLGSTVTAWGGKPCVKRFAPPIGRQWATTGAPYAFSPPSGMLGTFDYAADITASASETYYTYVLEVDCHFRVRG